MPNPTPAPAAQPLKPDAKPTDKAKSPTPAPTAKLPTSTTAAAKDAKTGKKAGNVEIQQKKATLVAQKIDPKFTPPYTPLKILFLSGGLKGKTLDLGFNINELSSSQTADWADTNEVGGIRVGSNFKGIGARTFSITLEYWSDNDDVQQLVENNAYLQSITDFAATPPLLQFILGSATIEPVVCTSFDPKYDTPLPKQGGFRHAQVGLSFKLLGGKGSVHQLAPPLSPTGLGNYLQDTTQAERAKQGEIAATEAQLAQCLGAEGSKQITNLMEKNQLGNSEAVARLSSRAFLQLAASGGLTKKMMDDPVIKEKLRNDLALTMVESENGSQKFATEYRNIAQALVSGDPSGLSGRLTEPVPVTEEILSKEEKKDEQSGSTSTRKTSYKTLFEMMSSDYNRILEAYEKQDFNLDPNSDKTAIGRLNNVASCGLQIKARGGIQAIDVSGREAAVLGGINQFLADPKTTDADIKKYFGLPDNTPETVIRKLRNGGPYETREAFVANSSYNRMGVTGVNLWNSFDKTETQTLADINGFVQQQNLSDDDIKKRFGVKDEKDIAEIRNGGKPFTSKEDFLHKVGAEAKGSDGKGNEWWNEFRQSQEKAGATPTL